jgi:hypothetical protein
MMMVMMMILYHHNMAPSASASVNTFLDRKLAYDVTEMVTETAEACLCCLSTLE